MSMAPEEPAPVLKQSPRATFVIVLGVAIVALGGLLLLMSSHQPEGGGRAVGKQLPELKAEGWLNGSAPTAGELNGKVVVIDVWASWCGPCLQQAPEMVQLYEKYHDQGVEFIGLTQETGESLEQLKKFLKIAGIKWRNGYGSLETLRMLDAEFLPMVWVADRNHRIVWNYGSSTTLEQGIQKALGK